MKHWMLLSSSLPRWRCITATRNTSEVRIKYWHKPEEKPRACLCHWRAGLLPHLPLKNQGRGRGTKGVSLLCPSFK